ncbi:conserved domain protein [Peptoniphilus sp. oral taxon 375 str. F0436]|nr:conserved domain protein [Peptoniphilus sp. oral taxon 375 str. F0436]
MASFVTHYFLGKEIQDHFSPKLKELIQGQENLYLLGNQGPDLFFFQISKQVKGEKT